MNAANGPHTPLRMRTAMLMIASIVACLLLLGARLVQVNTALRPDLQEIASRQQQGALCLPARRGTIFDRRGRVVALSRQMPDVFVDPMLVEDVDGLAMALAARVGRPAGEIAEKIRQRRPDPNAPPTSRFVVVARRVDEVAADAIRSMGHPAVGLAARAQREYPMAASMAQVLGWVGRDGFGMEGIELAYNEHLHGRDGRRETIRDARRRALRRSARPPLPPVDGGHLVLTLDAEIQRIAEHALAEAIEHFEAQSGVALVMSPRNGDVLAMVCLPNFDPADPGRVPPRLRRNRALTDPVEPGSTFKPILACGALDAGVVSPTEKIDCHQGSYRFGRRLVRDTHPNGILDLKGIITRSSNIGMGLIAERMGDQCLYDTIHRFGFGRPTGVVFPGESPGLVHPLSAWTDYSPTSLAMGYEVLVTPLQLANAFTAIVNDGVLLRPRLVTRLLDSQGHVMQAHDGPVPLGRAASSDTARRVAHQFLVSVVAHGGGRRAQTGPYRVMGKTGTARLAFRDRPGYEPDAYLSVFVGAAPVRDPQIVVLAMVRRPNHAIGYYGGQVAAPVVGEIIARVLAYLEVPPDLQLPAVSL